MNPRRWLKGGVRWMERRLPRPVFDALYDRGFPAYKAAVRWGYMASGALRHAPMDPRSWRRTRDIHAVMPRTLVGIGGLEATWDLAREMLDRGVPGDFVELGVARGGSAALLGAAIFERTGGGEPRRRLWLFDSFEGLPEPTAKDFGADHTTGDHVRPLSRGACLGTLEDVTDYLLTTLRFPADRVVFVKGWFEQTVAANAARIGAIAVLRIDGDWYESTKTCLDGLYDRVSVGGAVIVDDYGSCYGAQRALDEFLAARKLAIDLRFDGRGGCWFLKP